MTGLPSGGQYAFTPLQYDGIPVFSTFGLNSSAFDVYMRNDLGIERLEYVSGGASNLFGAGSVAGLINYISKTGSADPETTLQFEMAEEGRIRADFATSGPMSEGSDNYYALSGYYRYDEGPIDTGLPTEGFQLRGNFKREFADGSGSFTIYTQLIDDKVQFFLPFPLGADQSRTTGNDGAEVMTVQTAEADRLTYRTPDGIFTTPIRDGVATKGGMIAFDLTKELADGWQFNSKAKYASYRHQFNLFLDGDGITNQPLSLEDYLDSRDFGTEPETDEEGTVVNENIDAPNATATFTATGQEVPDGYLLFGNRLLDRDRPATDFTFEANLTRDFDMGAASHVMTFGTYVSRAVAGDKNYITTYLADFSNKPRLVDLTFNDGTNEVVISRNGLVRTNGLTGDNELQALRTAFYLTDQIETDRWSLDLGMRMERFEGDITKLGTRSVDMDQSEILNLQGARAATADEEARLPEKAAEDLTKVGTLDGTAQRANVSSTATALSAAFLLRISDDLNWFINLSQGYFFPEIRSVRISERGDAPYEEEKISQLETGVKLGGYNFTASASVFYTELDDRQNITFVNATDGSGGVITTANTTSAEAQGVELTGTYQLNDNLAFNANLTFQDTEFTEFAGHPDRVGNELRRNPSLLANTGFTYTSDRIDVGLYHSYNGENYVNDGNTIEADAFNLVNLNAGYTIPFGDAESLRIGLYIFNLLDSDGITEGSPRQASGQTVGEFFIGRPVLPRRANLRLTYDF
ncbi:MAG: TonB-dependent receptor [Cellvibrionales bacterium]|nr:TonB-dependent receptor [Cellvibrionales bacterium]